MNMMREFQKDELSKLTIHIESSVEDYIYNHINDLKSYIDVKTDSSGLNSKIDSIGTDLRRSAEDMLAASNKLLQASVFDDAMSDMKKANEILVSTMAENLNSQLQNFITSNISQNISDKFNLFDKKFTDTVVDKYEEIKLISSKYNTSFVEIEAAVQDLLSKFVVSKDEINKTITTVLEGINGSLDELSLSFADLKTQILNKAFDEAFQTSVNNQIQGLEDLIREQFGYLEDITDLCGVNLPELTEMNAVIKYSVLQAIEGVNSKLEAQDASVQNELNNLKTDIITQFLNIFNQISFVAEQEEILDFIQEKHSELITVLSHIVTTIDDVSTVKDNLAVVDNKVDTLKEDIDLINEKITSIISSDGDIDYVYSLQDLESDIANLRLSLNEIKQDNKSKELEELISSTNDIYELVDSIKKEIPNFNTEEFKKDFDALNEDIVSISTRTNKLILASDESYKTLQENLQDFKLVINDLDERTRNFAQDAGLDLVKIAPKAQPPVCKIVDYGKYRYEQARKEKEAKKKQKTMEVKEVRLSPNIDANDLNTKINQARKFLEHGDKVKVTLRFRGRELAHVEQSKVILDNFAEKLAEIAVIDKPAKFEGRSMTMFLAQKH